MFAHEKFEAYQLSIKFLEISLNLINKLPSGNAHMKDQLKRCATSISLNIAEGTGKKSKADRNKFYFIARGSAMESAAVCDVIVLIEPLLRKEAEDGKEVLESIVRILSKVCMK